MLDTLTRNFETGFKKVTGRDCGCTGRRARLRRWYKRLKYTLHIGPSWNFCPYCGTKIAVRWQRRCENVSCRKQWTLI